MKGNFRLLLLSCAGLLINIIAAGQRTCKSFDYQNQMAQLQPSLKNTRLAIDNFVSLHLASPTSLTGKVIVIPVVVHVLYHFPNEDISDQLVTSQIAALNRDYRKQNADTVNIPGVWRKLAADCGIEFRLATVDPKGAATSGIVRKYTPITKWTSDDQIKLSSKMGDDPWDANSYLNIWVGSLQGLLGYSSLPGDPAAKDGVVISNSVFGITNVGAFGQGRTAVHEVGHWLGLRHLWGDEDCGDDGVADTPKQETFTNGCPDNIRISCNNGPNGDMYMDYMDFTNDNCLVMFTNGQKQKMTALFQPGGPRNAILFSNGLGTPTSEAIPIPDESPRWLHARIYPNPASSELTLSVEFDARWIGKEIVILNELGQIQMKKTITSKVQSLNISQLKPGVYFISGTRDGDRIREEFVKF